ncbi:MAG: pyridoxamine 5'-phosphate oxidase [Rickettsiales bacterium]|nr:pyridoxamine 5'-phosphate oxidase [Rickettsiales bacterium]
MNDLFSSHNPWELFEQWLLLAKATPDITEPTAMSLATCNARGEPSVRIVLLKEIDERGFVFYTNYESRKSRELIENPHAALCFYWMKLDRQIRIRGAVERIAPEQSDAYFSSRGREKQIGACTSKQSQPLAAREQFEQEIHAMTLRFESEDTITRPETWGGWRIVPQEIEFWIQQPYRLHERRQFLREGDGWQSQLLYP